MKKVFAFLAVAAAVLTVSCKKENNNNNNNNNQGGGEYVQPITIDGKFDDWAKLDATKISTATCDPEAVKNALKVVKVYADEVFVFVYFEWDKDQITFENGVEHVPFHCYINGDGNATTGGYADEFLDACSDALFEGFIYPDGVLGSYDPAVYKWYGEPNATGWAWNPGSEDEPVLPGGSGVCMGAGIEGKYEFLITRELYPLGKLADKFSIGFDIQQGWETVGYLPNSHVTEDNPSGNANSLEVNTVK